MEAKRIIEEWYLRKGWKSFPFQQEVLDAYLRGKSGLLNAPTGSGKTFALWLPILAEFIRNKGKGYKISTGNGLQVLWITPLRALAKDIQQAIQTACEENEVPWTVATRTGDTSPLEKSRQKKHIPECLVTTPETLHVMLAQKGYKALFSNLKAVVVDEWHELLGTKRGVQVELGLSAIKGLRGDELKIWGISATIGNLEQAAEVLLGNSFKKESFKIIKSDVEKRVKVETIIPEEIEKFPWSGHLGIKLLPEVLKVVDASQTTLIFANTRSQAEIWYQYILLQAPHLAGVIALHHGSLDNEVRQWVENALHEGKLKAVVCTSSLDLGVDFRPVESVIQIGGPKGVARFLQRAGRSGHQPGAESRIWFVPTHSLELVEGAALKEALKRKNFESRKPLELSIDVLVQYLITLSVSEGFDEKVVFRQIKDTFSYRNLSDEYWDWVLTFLTTGGKSLGSYQDYVKLVKDDDLYKIAGKKQAVRHRLSIGTIVGDPVLQIRYVGGGFIGTIEESFISRLNPGDKFWFAGRSLEFVRLYEMTALVKKSRSGKGIIPQWMGGRMPLSSQMAILIREKVMEAGSENQEPELQKLKPLIEIQKRWSKVPDQHELLIEKFKSREGYHLFIYPFEGRYVHEILATVFTNRISRIQPHSFSVAFNDYGLELLSDQEIPLEKAVKEGLFSAKNFLADLRSSLNNGEMARRKFRDIAVISGLVFQGFPGKGIKNRHLQASSKLFFEVFQKYDPGNLLLEQAYEEVINMQLEQSRLTETMKRLSKLTIVIAEPEKPTPFSFPIMVDRFREHMSYERLEDRVMKMQLKLEKLAEKEIKQK